MVIFVFLVLKLICCSGITFISIGFGTFGSKIAEIAINDYNMECLGVFNRETNVGKDISTIIDLNKNVNIKIRGVSDLSLFLKSNKVDIVFQATRSNINDTFEQIKLCLECGINVISLAEELWFPWNTSPKKAQILHDIAIKNGVSIIGTGGQDVAANKILLPLLDSVPKFNKIDLNYNFNLQHPYYWKYIRFCGINLNITESEKFIQESIMLKVLKVFIQPIIERVVVNILQFEYDINNDISTECKSMQIFNELETYICLGCSDNLKTVKIKYPNSIGIECKIVVNTKQNVIVSGTMKAALFHHHNGWNVDWTVSGKYNTEKLALYDLDDLPITSIAAINRVNDAMQKTGLITDFDVVGQWTQTCDETI